MDTKKHANFNLSQKYSDDFVQVSEDFWEHSEPPFRSIHNAFRGVSYTHPRFILAGYEIAALVHAAHWPVYKSGMLKRYGRECVDKLKACGLLYFAVQGAVLTKTGDQVVADVMGTLRYMRMTATE